MLRCEFIPGKGRFAVAAANIPAGSFIFREYAYAVAQRVGDTKHQHCVYCCRTVKVPTEECIKCNSVFCSLECAATHSKAHLETGECGAIIVAKIARTTVPKEDMDTFEMLCLILGSCAAEGKTGRLTISSADADGDKFETVAFGQELTGPLEFLNTGAPPQSIYRPSYDHVECLCTNLRETDAEIVGDFSKLYDIYQKVLQNRKYLQRIRSVEHHLPTAVSRDVFVGICTAFLCNGFGIWSAAHRQLGVSLYPESSYFNHSCAPNMGRRNCKGSRVIEFFAARDIEEGEQLCISYVNLKLPVLERKAKLKATYSFDCGCERCRPDADIITANTVSCSCVPALCCDCISQVMQPIGDGMYICPCCDAKQLPS